MSKTKKDIFITILLLLSFICIGEEKLLILPAFNIVKYPYSFSDQKKVEYENCATIIQNKDQIEVFRSFCKKYYPQEYSCSPDWSFIFHKDNVQIEEYYLSIKCEKNITNNQSYQKNIQPVLLKILLNPEYFQHFVSIPINLDPNTVTKRFNNTQFAIFFSDNEISDRFSYIDIQIELSSQEVKGNLSDIAISKLNKLSNLIKSKYNIYKIKEPDQTSWGSYSGVSSVTYDLIIYFALGVNITSIDNLVIENGCKIKEKVITKDYSLRILTKERSKDIFKMKIKEVLPEYINISTPYQM